MNPINFEQIKEMDVAKLNEIEEQVSKLPEGFKLIYKKPEENYAENLLEDLK